MDDIKMSKLFAWVGGKHFLASQLKSLAPSDFNRYYEPFCGSATMFFSLGLEGKDVFLNDRNVIIGLVLTAVLSSHAMLKRAISRLQTGFRQSAKRGGYIEAKSYFLSQRDTFNRQKFCMSLRSDSSRTQRAVSTAALFFFLLNTAYGGLYRENRRGEFNVAFGPKNNDVHGVVMHRSERIDEAHAYMKRQRKIIVTNDDFEYALRHARRDDFVYMDPPYWQSSEASGSQFTSYTSASFTHADQLRVHRVFDRLTKRGCKVMLTNANVAPIKKLYKNYRQIPLRSPRNLFRQDGDPMYDLAIINYTPTSSQF